MNDHTLTETRIEELWEANRNTLPRWLCYFEDSRADFKAMFRAAHDAGREYERGHADPHHDPRPWQDCTRKDIRAGDLVEARSYDGLRIDVAHHQDQDGDWRTEDGYLLTWGDRWPLRRIPAPTRPADPLADPEQAPAEPSARTLLGVPDTHGAPHHDVKAIRAGDFVVQVDKDGRVRGGIAHSQDEEGDWYDEIGRSLTWACVRADRPDAVTVWSAPTPPAEEVELPTEHPAHITDVEDVDGDVCAHMVLDNVGGWIGVDQDGDAREWTPEDVTAFTLPPGTRARRDGKREDGRPRFVKVQEEEK